MQLSRREQRPSTTRVYFLMYVADGADGVCRTALNLANCLVERHQVEVIALYRRRRELTYAIDPRIKLSYLEDVRPLTPDGGRVGGLTLARHAPERGRMRSWLDRRRSRLIDAEVAPNMSALTDLLLLRKLRTLKPGVLITTRPSLHLLAARLAPEHVIKIAQDHLNFETRSRELGMLDLIAGAAHRGLDCLVTLTQGDAGDYARLLEDAGTAVTAIPNALPWQVGEASPLTSKVIVSAGRLVTRKGMDRLIRAYAPVAREHPDWQLRIYGKGILRDQLQELIDQSGVSGQVILEGHSSQFESVLADASVFASGARSEGFPMVMVEALSKGVPLVSFDCPRGPGEIIEDGENGRLVPDGDIAAMTQALREIEEDDEARARLGKNALESARAYTPERVAARWEALFETLLDRRRRVTHP